MNCPYCVYGNTLVLESSWDSPHQTISRVRHCLDCSYQWKTLEIDQDQVEFLDDLLQKRHNSDFPATTQKGQPTGEGSP